MRDAGHFVIPHDHPCLPGHFPGHPLVPGVVLLDAALSLVRANLPPCRLAGLATTKFIAMVHPGDEVAVRHGPAVAIPGRVAFECRVTGRVVASGTARLAEPGT